MTDTPQCQAEVIAPERGERVQVSSPTSSGESLIDSEISRMIIECESGSKPAIAFGRLSATVCKGVTVDVNSKVCILRHLAKYKHSRKAGASLFAILGNFTVFDATRLDIAANNGMLTNNILQAVVESTTTALGVLCASEYTLEKYLESCPVPHRGFEATLTRMRHQGEQVETAVSRSQSWNISISSEALAIDSESVSLLGLSGVSSELTQHRLIGCLKLFGASSQDNSSTVNTVLTNTLDACYLSAAKVAEQILPELNSDKIKYSAAMRSCRSGAAGRSAAERLRAFSKLLPQEILYQGVLKPASAELVSIVCHDDVAGESTSLQYMIYCRWLGSRTTIALYMCLTSICEDISCITAIIPHHIESVSHMIYRALLRYGGDFAARPVAAASVIVEDLSAAVSFVDAMLQSPVVCVVKMEDFMTNRPSEFFDGCGISALNMTCLIDVGGIYRICTVKITMEKLVAIRDIDGTNGGERFTDACALEIVSPAHLLSIGVPDDKALRRVALGSCSDLDVCGWNATSKPDFFPSLCRSLESVECCLRKLEVSGFPLQASGGQALAAALDSNKSICWLGASSCEFGDEMGVVLAKAIGTHPMLEWVALDNNSLCNAAGVALGEAASQGKLTALQLRRNFLGDVAGLSLAQALSNDQCELLNLDVRDNRIAEEGCVALAQSLESNRSLESLDLQNNLAGACTGEALGVALTCNNKLRFLNLWGCQLGDRGGVAIGKGLARNGVLQTLILNECNLDEEAGIEIGNGLRANVTLRELHLRCNLLGEEAGLSIGRALSENSTLTVLSLFRNALGDRSGVMLGNALSSETALVHLDLSFNQLGEDAGQAIGSALSKNKTLTKLLLGGNGLARSIKPNRQLARLRKTSGPGGMPVSSGIGDKGALAIAKSLVINEILCTLEVNANQIGDTGGVALAEAITNSEGLTMVNLNFNPFGMPARIALTKCAEENPCCKLGF